MLIPKLILFLFPILTGPYFGQEPPGLEPELFAPDIVSSHRFEHGSVTFSPDGTEAFWSSSFLLGDAGYSTSRLFTAGGLGMGDIYRCALVGDTWTAPMNLGAPINGESSEGSPFIAPDESYLLVVRNGHPACIGGADLFVSFREPDGGWREPVVLPPPLNTPSNEQCPTVSRDGKYLFFNSHRGGNADVYWVDAQVIERLGSRSQCATRS